ncbi:hypothetical protein Pmar_PMAR000774 [Perkinsus marinus ATCC 50983]|uniref:Uncharacterized protein n=1 Tax=Perkinsus marinus (strain ATCC 50983 / TXsc) TaxID=423536 RepID=C5KXK5_PERM5|nr:hypothetical protein Pmar_PMAR000774 [Perkinsus marinus ATCC 50983]EER10729.1 hypothetical protein Pmar_PMAR000774 [Perkinsus marinus ATCC 50983]|eukprot:XP_002778934.1 hypothetical protein Pmar_PMAR000774 [Perkinsus marinus ATCC 50983]
MRLTHIRDCVDSIEGPAAVAEVSKALTALLRGIHQGNEEVEDRYRYLAELALAAREELKRVMAEEAPRERARLRKLEDELNAYHTQRVEEVNEAWEKERRKMDALTKRLQERLAEFGQTGDARGIDGDEASEETARTNLDLKLELARMRKLHKHANEVNVGLQLELAIMSSKAADQNSALEACKRSFRSMEETARMTLEDLRATLVVHRRLGKTLELMERNVVRGRSGSMGGPPQWEEASEKGLELSHVSKSLTHKYVSRRYRDAIGFKAVAPDELQQRLMAMKEGGISSIVNAFCRKLNDKRGDSVRAVPEPLPWMMRRPSVKAVFDTSPPLDETMSLDQTRELSHSLMDGWTVEALSVVGDFSQKTIAFPEYVYQFVTAERLGDHTGVTGESMGFAEYLRRAERSGMEYLARMHKKILDEVGTDVCLAYHTWRYMVHGGPHNSSTEYLTMHRVWQCIFQALPLRSPDLLTDVFQVLSELSAVHNERDRFPADMLLRLLMEEYLVERDERMVSLMAMSDVALEVARRSSLSVGQVEVLVRTFFPACPMGCSAVAMALSREAMRVHPEGIVDTNSLRVAVEEGNLMCHQLVVHMFVSGQSCCVVVSKWLDELMALVSRAMDVNELEGTASRLALLSSTTAIHRVLTCDPHDKTSFCGGLQQIVKLYAEVLVAVMQTGLYFKGGAPSDKPGLQGSGDVKVLGLTERALESMLKVMKRFLHHTL